MKLKSGYNINKIGEEYILIPSPENVNKLKGSMLLNETSAFAVSVMQNDTTIEEIVKKITDKYDIDEKTAVNDLKSLVSVLKEHDLLD